MGLHNDLVSFEKDGVREGTVTNNAVLATQHFFGGTVQDAANVVADLVSARVRESWLAGYHALAGRTGRYRAPAPPTFTFHRLTHNKIGRMPSDRR